MLAVVLTAAGCGTDSEPGGSPGTGSAGSAGKDDRPKSPAGSLTWEFEHIADYSGDLADVAVLAEDDIWAVGTENNGESNAHLLHYDGTKWKREPLPEALGDSTYAPLLEEVGGEALWLRPQGSEDGAAVRRWAQWDGTRWSTVPSPPPGNVGDFEAAGPDDIWALDSERTAQHWDGTRWTTTRLPYGASDLAVVGPDDVWAVGSRSTGPGTQIEGSGDGYSQPASMHWDGTSWKAVETPQARFEEPLPPEPSAGLGQVFALDSGEVRAYGSNSFNHGEVENEPADEFIQLRWDGSKWVEQEGAPGGCARRTPVGQDDKGLFLDGNWYMTDDGRCVKIKRHRLPLSTGARKGSNQSLWLEEIHRVPGTGEWLGAGHVQVNQSGDPFGAPVVVRLKREG
ncbi:hypothetical protein [Streptomyces sp. BA2]|uniref:hypothetical protein n=1 Tax=Streptomyces sp. BA2 TaxID=436595 RepID=UPI00132C0403|nr:hypothetical protein [Streptomyces sp. BA2]MWA15834.1 hypothetical protein [Streptomyces sp. BA2]